MASTIRGIESYIESPHNFTHYWHNCTLFTTLDTALIRNIGTTVFVVLNFLTVLFGAFFIKSLNLRTLSKLRTVPVNHLTSWLASTDALRYLSRTRQLPGGYCGLLMLLTGMFSLGHQYFTNSFIQRATLQSDCPFESGIVTTLVANDQGGGMLVPSSTFSAARTVYNAQLQVWLNGGAWGIYQKVNSNSTTFSPTIEDVIGGWNCAYHPYTNISWADWQNMSDVKLFLQKQKFLFTEASAFSYERDMNDGGIKGFLEWSADQQDNSTLGWTVRASVSNDLSGLRRLPPTVRTVTNIECALATSSWPLPSMPSNQSLHEWAAKTYGFLMAAEPSKYAFLIEWMLNAMVMVAGSENYDQWYPTDLPKGASTIYGCRVPGTKIKPEFWVILGLMLLIFVPFVLADIVLFYFRIICGCWNDNRAHLANTAPSGVEDWQLALITGETGDETITVSHLKDHFYGWDGSKRKYRIIGDSPKW